MSVITGPGEMFMFPVSRKIYCKDCKYFTIHEDYLDHGETRKAKWYKCHAPKNLEEKTVYRDTWYEPIPETKRVDYKHPSVRNKKNDCPLFEQNHEEKEGDWTL